MARGEKYEGEPCKTCGSTIRYVSCKQCVDCQCRLSNEKAKRNREAASKRYHGKPCRKCGKTERYISTNACCNCMYHHNLRRYQLSTVY